VRLVVWLSSATSRMESSTSCRQNSSTVRHIPRYGAGGQHITRREVLPDVMCVCQVWQQPDNMPCCVSACVAWHARNECTHTAFQYLYSKL
jgi:hypothetical protein